MKLPILVLQLQVPVGPETLGRIINVIGEPIDQKGKVSTKERWSIHRPAPKFTDQSTETEILVTGIKVVDLCWLLMLKEER